MKRRTKEKLRNAGITLAILFIAIVIGYFLYVIANERASQMEDDRLKCLLNGNTEEVCDIQVRLKYDVE